ncbi:DNA repair protein RecN [Oscillospiraceae bacterium OttesenSCG-928-G22]|nr:DNA repair protein RecN [Oscillospiraceae bacterium OttesenSCG-928-G22]
MLEFLHIENIAVVERSEIAFGPGFNVLTGETGAGKSIVIDALSMVLGARASKDLVRTGAEQASVSALFTELSDETLAWLSENGYEPDEDGSLLIRRQMTTAGKNLVKINGSPATVSLLRELGELLVNIHGQHDTLLLRDGASHLGFLDRFAGTKALLTEYGALYEELRVAEQTIRKLQMDEAEKEERIRALRYQIEEIEAAELRIGEEEELSARRTLLRSAAQVTEALDESYFSLYGDNDTEGALGLLSEAETSFSRLSQISDTFSEVSAKLAELRYSLEDVTERVRDFRYEFEFSPEEIDMVESRLALIQRLIKKYGADVPELLAALERFRTELTDIEYSEEALSRAQKKRDEIHALAREKAELLSAARKRAAETLSRRIREELADLNMDRVTFVVAFEKADGLTSTGFDEVSFLISANAGEEPKPISKIASGGELARIMLAMKNIENESGGAMTMVFDEVDSGVSGRTAQKVAEKLYSVSKGRQVLSVSHLPQIAAMADNHFLIEKNEVKGRTITTVERLDIDGRIGELARITGGADITETTEKNAAELLAKADTYKQSSKEKRK